MKKVMQTDNNNCFQACIASIFEIEIEEIPNLAPHEENGKWIIVLNKWLQNKYKLNYIESYISLNEGQILFKQGTGYYHIIIGVPSINKVIKHAVVGYAGKIIFDPHPKKIGIGNSNKRMRVGLFINTFN